MEAVRQELYTCHNIQFLRPDNVTRNSKNAKELTSDVRKMYLPTWKTTECSKEGNI